MSQTNAQRHEEREQLGEWRVSEFARRCDRPFGFVAQCAHAILPGQRYFDTHLRMRPGYSRSPTRKACEKCGNALARLFPVKEPA